MGKAIPVSLPLAPYQCHAGQDQEAITDLAQQVTPFDNPFTSARPPINKVFGIGLSRTGTLSLQKALQILGYRAVHFPSNATTYRELIEGNYRLTVLQAYDAATDISVGAYYPQLDKLYPGSRFILTVREKQSWLASVRAHWETNGWTSNNPKLHENDICRFINGCVYGCYAFDEDRFSYVYDRYYRNVLDYFTGRKDLLIINLCAGESWEPLCRFLGKAIPSAPFPHEHKRHRFSVEAPTWHDTSITSIMQKDGVMHADEALKRISQAPHWHYQFDLLGHRTPVYNPNLIVRQEWRKSYFFDPVVRLLGGSLTGKRVLDLGCNAGFWALQAIESGCDSVLGIDARPKHIAQANLVFEAKGVDRRRYEFQCANVLDVSPKDLGDFDLVLCVGLLYHTCKPMSLLEWAARVNTDVLVIDSNLSSHNGSVLEARHEPLEDPRNACDYELVFWPSRRAVLDMVEQLGYGAVVLKPSFTNSTGVEDFHRGQRRAFVCAKRTSLNGFPADVEDSASVESRDRLSLPAPEVPPLAQLKPVRGAGCGCVDTVGGRSVGSDGQFHINRRLFPSGLVGVHGWVAGARGRRSLRGAYLTVDASRSVPVEYYRPRPDVALHFRAEDYLLTGFECSLPIASMVDGIHAIELQAVFSEGDAYEMVQTVQLLLD
jgi:2-polyprenyl-3-methyl-5-hydroxy-6-metoxy-1,4-benzoquinol methylase